MAYPAEFISFAGGFAGLSGAIALIATAFVKSHSGKGQARADAAKMLAVGYGSLADRLARERDCLDKDNARLRKAITALINAQNTPTVDTAPCKRCAHMAIVIRAASTAVIESSEHC